MELKNVRRGRIREYAEKFTGSGYTPLDGALSTTRSGITSGVRLPERDAERDQRARRANLLRNGVYVVSEGANMPSTIGAIISSSRRHFSSVPAKPQRRRRRDLQD
jgi:glutamate dehydrogenase (NADP+)